MQFTPPARETLCACGMYPRGSYCPYCEIPQGGVSKTHRIAKSEVEELAAIDARLEAARKAGEQMGAPQGANPAKPPAVQKPKRKRRSREEMAEARAEEADRIRRIRRRVTPEWLADQDAVEGDFLAVLTRGEQT